MCSGRTLTVEPSSLPTILAFPPIPLWGTLTYASLRVRSLPASCIRSRDE